MDEFWAQNPDWTPDDDTQVEIKTVRGKDGRLKQVRKVKKRQRVKRSKVLSKEDQARLEEVRQRVEAQDGSRLQQDVRKSHQETVRGVNQ